MPLQVMRSGSIMSTMSRCCDDVPCSHALVRSVRKSITHATVEASYDRQPLTTQFYYIKTELPKRAVADLQICRPWLLTTNH